MNEQSAKSSDTNGILDRLKSCRSSYLFEVFNSVLLAAISTALILWIISLLVSGIKALKIEETFIREATFELFPPVAAWILYAISSVSILCLIVIIVGNLWNRFNSRKGAQILTYLAAIIFTVSQIYSWEIADYLSSLGLLCSLTYLLWPQLPSKEAIEIDRLHRSFFANRIVSYLTKENPPLRRIAVSGSWGSGKTFLLRLIDSKLKQIDRLEHNSYRIRTIWVNPWKATNQAEAMQIFAAAFDRVHSVTPIATLLKRAIPLFKSASSLAPVSNFGNLVLEAISSHYPDESKIDLSKIDRALEVRRIRLVVFVDDMERADPSAVRGILPVIDKLTELKNCYFVFGIDRDRIEDAFIHLEGANKLELTFNNDPEKVIYNNTEGSKAKDYVTGFLDKVMDLQLELPECSDVELYSFAQALIEQHSSTNPKLYSAYPSIRTYLPRNPRICKKFLELAIQSELLYFSDYADDDRDFSAVFLVLIGESEFPGYRKTLAEDLSWATFSRLEWMDKANGTDSADKEKDSFVRAICSKLNIPLDRDNYSYTKIAKLHAALCERVGERSLFYTRKYESPRWVTSDFMARRELSPQDMESIVNDWYKAAPSVPIDRLINSRYGEEAPSDLPVTIYQILVREITKCDGYLTKLKQEKGTNASSDKPEYKEVLSFFRKLASHFSGSLSKAELEVINSIESNSNGINPLIFERLIDLIKTFPIADNSEEDLKAIRDFRVSAISAILKQLELESAWRYLSDIEVKSYSNYGMYESSRLVTSEIHDISNLLKEKLAAVFYERIRSEVLDSVIVPTKNEKYNPFIIYEPQRWLPKLNDKSNHYDLSKIEDLGTEIHKNTILADNIFKATRRYFIGPCFELSKLNADNAEWMHHLKNLTNEPGGNSYIRSFWSLALKDPIRERREELLKLRNQAYDFFEKQDGKMPAEGPKPNNRLDKNNLLLSASTFDSCFPVEQPATKP